MLLRVGAVEVPLWQIATSLVLLAAGTVVVASRNPGYAAVLTHGPALSG